MRQDTFEKARVRTGSSAFAGACATPFTASALMSVPLCSAAYSGRLHAPASRVCGSAIFVLGQYEVHFDGAFLARLAAIQPPAHDITGLFNAELDLARI